MKKVEALVKMVEQFTELELANGDGGVTTSKLQNLREDIIKDDLSPEEVGERLWDLVSESRGL
jgi:hypothetical protein